MSVRKMSFIMMFMLSSASSRMPLYTSPLFTSTVHTLPSASCSRITGKPTPLLPVTDTVGHNAEEHKPSVSTEKPEIFVDYESRSNKLVATPKLTRTAGFVSGKLCIASTAETERTRQAPCGKTSKLWTLSLESSTASARTVAAVGRCLMSHTQLTTTSIEAKIVTRCSECSDVLHESHAMLQCDERDEGQELRDKLDAIDARAAVAGADQEAALKEYRAILEYEPTGPEGAASESLQRVKEDSIYSITEKHERTAAVLLRLSMLRDGEIA
eukprot:16765-Heterococcus_DN1.PRE.2